MYYMILIHEFHVLKLRIEMTVYDPAAPLMQWQEGPEKFRPEPAPSWPDSLIGNWKALHLQCIAPAMHCTCNV